MNPSDEPTGPENRESSRKRIGTRAATVISAAVITSGFLTVSALTPAAAAPTPRGPVGGCGQGFDLETLEDLQARFGRAPTQFDSNLDGAVCLRLAPPQQADAFTGIVVDNTAVGQV